MTAGYGVVEQRASRVVHIDNGLILAPRKAPLGERLKVIYAEVVGVIERFQPHVIAIESVFFNKNVHSALQLGHARGVVLLAAAQYGAETASYAPAEVKKTVTGRGRATKLQVQMMVKVLLGLPEPAAEDAADALAMAICHCHRRGAAAIGTPGR